MMTNKLFKSLVSFLVIALLSVSLFTVGVFAEEEAADNVLLSAPADGAAADSSADETIEETAAPTEDKSEAESDASEEVPTTGAEEEKEGLGLGFWISLGIFGALIIAGVILAIIKREAVGKWWKSYKSELKKIVWSPWKQVRKNSLVVFVVVVACTAIICALDLVFSQGILTLGGLF
jgi:preprotein translocase SecE subunit